MDAAGMMGFAVVDMVVNGAAVLRLKSGESLNEKVVRLHLLEDVLGWVAVLLGGVILHFFDFPIIDPLLSVAITLYVLYNVVRNLRQSMKILLQATPPNINLKDVEEKLVQLPGMKLIHDLHIWTLDGTYNVLTLHAVTDPDLQMPQAEVLKKRYGGPWQTWTYNMLQWSLKQQMRPAVSRKASDSAPVPCCFGHNSSRRQILKE